MRQDPEYILEAFQAEEDEFLDLQSTKYKKRRSLEAGQLSNKAVLSFCLMTGITAGAGVAQAKASPQTESNPSVVQKEKIFQNEMIPPDEPISNSPEQQKKSESPKLTTENEQENQSKSVSNDMKETIPPIVIPPDKPISNLPKSSQELKEPDSKELTINKEKENKSLQKKENTEQKANQKKQTFGQKTTGGKKKPYVSTKKDSRQTHKNQEYVAIPKTVKGGELPKTAGNDLSTAVASGLVAFSAGAYLTSRKRNDPNEMG